MSGLPPVTFFHTEILVVFCSICNRYPVGLFLIDLEVYKKNFCIEKLVTKKVTSWEP